MDTSYKTERVDLDVGQHDDAKEVNDLINAIISKDGSLATEALEAVMALWPDMTDDDRFVHLYKVMTGAMSNQLQARFLEPSEPPQPGVGATSNP